MFSNIFRGFVAPLASHAPGAAPIDAFPVAIVAPVCVADFATSPAPKPVRFQSEAPLVIAADAYEDARRAGAPPEAAMARAVHVLAFADLGGLDLNGPHAKAGDRISRKAERKARRLLQLIAERGGAL
jgi:hypothetical protein